MEDWVLRALARWPDVPALYGWLRLDRRGRWLIRGERISRPQILDTLNRNYAADADGRWYFQNGPQRGYVSLDTAPYVLWTAADGRQLVTHTGARVRRPRQAFLDADGGLLLLTEHGPAQLSDHDLDWLLDQLYTPAGALDDAGLAAALARPSGAATELSLRLDALSLPVTRLDREQAEATLGFVREPQPRPGEKAVVGGPDEPPGG